MKPFVPDYPINLFEIAFLTDKQLSLFQSDFGIVADYFVQMRKNREYKPTEQQFKHVREVLQMMSVLTNDRRFGNAVQAAEKGKEPENMCEALDKVENKGRLEQAKKSAFRMKERGFSIGDIAYVVDRDIETVNQWFEAARSEGYVCA